MKIPACAISISTMWAKVPPLMYHLEFTDQEYKKIGKGSEDRYSLTPIDVKTYDPNKKIWRPELADTEIYFREEKFSFRVKGCYKDLNEDRKFVDQSYDYPARVVER